MRFPSSESRAVVFWGRVAVLAGILVVVTAMVGCTASGAADFVKFSPDSRRIVYQDTMYPRVYVYYTQTKQKHVFEGRVACVDREVTRMVLLAIRSADYEDIPDPIPCSLVRLDDCPPQVVKLPGLPRGEVWWWKSHASMEFESEPDRLVAQVYSELKRGDPLQDRYYRLHIGDSEWVPSPPPEPTREWAFRTGGLVEGGHAYWQASRGFGSLASMPAGLGPIESMWAAASKPADAARFEAILARWQAMERDGIDLESGRPQADYLLHSPDGRFVVRIADADGPWKRVTIVDAGDRTKEILLDKNDAALDVLHTLYMWFIFDPFVLLIGGI